MADNNLFPRKSDIFKDSILDVRDTLARTSLDTLYQVTFSFGKSDIWLDKQPGKKRTQGTDFKRKMSLLCTQAEIPGTSYVTTPAIGHHQGIQEEFPNLRNFPPLNLTFYCDVDMVILEVIEKWMTYINPVQKQKRDYAAYTRFNYPEDYKEILHVTKFERDTFTERPSEYKSAMAHYEFVNIWPTDFTSMRVAYGDPNVLQCSVQFAYDRFFTSFDELEGQAIINTSNGLINSNDAVPGGYTFSRDGINLGGNTDKMVKSDNNLYGNSWPAGSSSITKTPIKNKRGRTVGYKIGS